MYNLIYKLMSIYQIH